MSIILKKLHKHFVYNSRLNSLKTHIISICKDYDISQILDIGAGDGALDRLLLTENPLFHISGIDTLKRPFTFIPIEEYDGAHINLNDNSVEATMLIDVLHHTDNIAEVLKEASRVSKKYIIIKDHIVSDDKSLFKLKLMDYVGNKPNGVSLPYNYLSKDEWDSVFGQLGLSIKYIKYDLHLYSGLFHSIFDSDLHFIALLEKEDDIWN